MLHHEKSRTTNDRELSGDASRKEAEALRILFDSVFSGIVIHTTDGKILDVNQTWCQMHGVDASRARQLTIADLSDPSMGMENARAIWAKVLAGDPQLFEWKSRRACDGRAFDAEIFLRRLVLQGRHVILGTVQDITGRKRVEEQLRIQSAALKSAANAICITNKDGTIQWINPAFCQLTGYTYDEVMCQNPRVLKSGLHTPEFYRDMWTIISGGQVWSGTLSNRRKDGSLYTEEMTVTPVRDESGEITHYIAIKQDVTLRKTAEEALERQNLQLSILNDAAEALLADTNAEATLNRVYDRMSKYFQIDSFVEFKLSDDGGELELVALNGVAASGLPNTKNMRLGAGVAGKVAQTGEPIFISNALTSDDPDLQFVREIGANAYACEPLRIGGRVFGTLSFASSTRSHFDPEDQEFFRTLANYISIAKERQRLTDLLKRHANNLEEAVRDRTVQLVEANANLQTFAYTAAHDLRSPLRSILTFSTLAQEEHAGELPPEVRVFLAKVIGSAKQMTDLLNDLLEYSQLTQAELKLSSVDLRGAVAEAFTLLDEEIRGRSAVVTADDTMAFVTAHRATLVVVIANLLSNALKFVPSDRKPVIVISSEARDSFVRINVKDNGIGISERDQEKLFQLFTRLHGKGVYPGTGLGLALVKRAVERLGGTVGVESNPGKGSCFWIELKAAGQPS